MFVPKITNGFLNIEYTLNNSYLHSARDPYREVRLKFKALKPKPGAFLTLFGAGSGYAIEEAFKAHGVNEFLVVEPDREIRRIADNCGPLSRLDSSALTIYPVTPENFNENILANLIMMKSAGPILVYESAYFSALSPEFLNTVKNEFNNGLKKAAAALKALSESGFFRRAETDPNSMMLKEILFSFDRTEVGA